MVPGHPDNGGIPFKKIADDIVFHTAVEQEDSVFSISIYFLFAYTHTFHQVMLVGIIAFRHIPVENHFAQHGSLFTQQFGNQPGIHVKNTGYPVLFQPVAQASLGIPVRIFR